MSVESGEKSTLERNQCKTDNKPNTFTFPHPVSPTRRTGSFCLIHLITNVISLMIDCVGAIDFMLSPDDDDDSNVCPRACSKKTRPADPSP